MTATSSPAESAFIRASLPKLFARTALPMIALMLMNGLLTVVDAVFLGVFVGAEALGAVTLMFPVMMLLVALSALISNGMSSLVARHLGGGNRPQAQAVFLAAQALALLTSLALMLALVLFGDILVLAVAAGREALAEMGATYLRISVFCSPLMLSLGVQGDALRNEGRAGQMALLGLGVTLANMLFNYLLIVVFELGVAGSAYGTALAQLLALLLVLGLRLGGRTTLRPGLADRPRGMGAWLQCWLDIVKLGAPQSLAFLGIALTSGAIIYSLQAVASTNYAATVSAYGIITRLLTFCFLPLLGLSQALQSIGGHNYGARLWQRSDDSLRLGIALALCYCLVVELSLVFLAGPIGGLFVTEAGVVAEVERILPIMVALYIFSGPVMMIAAYFQAIGDAGRAALLSLVKPYLLLLPLILLLPGRIGETGIWLASPIAEGLLLLLTLALLWHTSRQRGLGWGLFYAGVRQPHA